MFGLFLRPKFQGISPQNMAKHMVLAYLHFRILKLPLINTLKIKAAAEVSKIGNL